MIYIRYKYYDDTSATLRCPRSQPLALTGGRQEVDGGGGGEDAGGVELKSVPI